VSAAGSYEQTSTRATLVELPAVPSDPEAEFSWIEGGTPSSPMQRTVSFTATLSTGSVVTANANFRVVRPDSVVFTGIICPQVPQVNIGNYVPTFAPDQLFLKLGYVEEINNGIVLKADVTTTAATSFGGNYAVVQLVRSQIKNFPNNLPLPQTFNTVTHVLDVHPSSLSDVQYGGIVLPVPAYNAGFSTDRFVADTPLEPLLSSSYYYERNDEFQSYFMYRPPGSRSIWVVLARVDWGWSGTASAVGEQWIKGDFGQSPNVLVPQNLGSVALPQWQSNIRNP